MDPDRTETEIVALLTAARERDRASDSLRARVERERAQARRPAARRRLRVGVAAAGALAVIAVVLALALPAGTPGTPSLAQAAALALRGPTAPAPPVTRRAQGTRLGAAVDEVYFPDWTASLGWRATGQRTDTIGGRRAVTVYYARAGHEVAYTIVATPPLPEPSAQTLTAGSLTVRALTQDGRTLVTWRRSGDTCVLSSAGLSAAALARLASWSS